MTVISGFLPTKRPSQQSVASLSPVIVFSEHACELFQGPSQSLNGSDQQQQQWQWLKAVTCGRAHSLNVSLSTLAAAVCADAVGLTAMMPLLSLPDSADEAHGPMTLPGLVHARHTLCPFRGGQLKEQINGSGNSVERVVPNRNDFNPPSVHCLWLTRRCISHDINSLLMIVDFDLLVTVLHPMATDCKLQPICQLDNEAASVSFGHDQT
ncbi:hypothetical protein TYRP_004727 [Tyrophagus putrescentiae]|nr:hypothetical protein TYRP_004727 [Tyrophagus putrescentiae]